MADIDKVIKGLERCLVCEMSPIAPAEGQKAYLECEYTIGLYCGRDRLLRDALKVLKEQPKIVRCGECKHMYEDNQFMCGIRGLLVDENFYCADGERRTDDA